MEKNFQKKLLDIASGLCLFDSYLTLGGIETFEDKLFYLVKAMSKNLVGEDGYVKDADRLYRDVLGQEKTVTKTYEYDKEGPVIACFDNTHFVIVDGKDKQVIYDPLGPRKNPYKEITSYRVVSNL